MTYKSDIICRVQKILNQDGPLGLIKGAIRWLIWRGKRIADPLYQFVKPESRIFNVGPATARFDMSEASLYYHDFRADLQSERKIIKLLLSTLSENDVFYDIGANIGIYSLFASDLLPNKNVVAFEPHPGRANMLRRNAKLNDHTLILKEFALSDTTGEMELITEGTTRHHLAANTNLDCEPSTTVPVARGDDLIANTAVQSPNVIKIDVEGGEMNVLRGLEQTLQDGDCRVVFCEIHPDQLREFDATPEDVKEFLLNCGYTIEHLEERKENYFIQASR